MTKPCTNCLSIGSDGSKKRSITKTLQCPKCRPYFDKNVCKICKGEKIRYMVDENGVMSVIPTGATVRRDTLLEVAKMAVKNAEEYKSLKHLCADSTGLVSDSFNDFAQELERMAGE